MIRLPATVLAVAVLGLYPGMAHGETLYGVAWVPGDHLITIDTTTGAGTLIGPLGFLPNGLAFRGAKLYSYTFSAGVQELNPATGATVATTNVGIVAASWYVGGLAFRSDGIGFVGNGPVGVPPPPPTQSLYTFDITVPNSSLVTGNFGLSFGSLAFSPADVLYGFDGNTQNLCTINQATGAVTLVGNTGAVGAGGVAGLTFDSGGNLFLAYGNGVLPSNLYKVNLVSGAATLVGSIGLIDVQGLAFPGGGLSAPATALPPGAAGEGSYTGVADPPHPGGEGSFGFGFGGQLAAKTSRPTLAGPFLASAGAGRTLAPSGLANNPPPGTCLQVCNTAGTTTAPAASQPASSGAAGALGFTLLTALGLAVAVGLGKGISALRSTSSNTTTA